jgi:hypothetical protein
MNVEEFYEKQKQALSWFVTQKRLNNCQDDLSEEDWHLVYHKFYHGIKQIKSKLDQTTVETFDCKYFFPTERQAVELPCHTCKHFFTVMDMSRGWMCDKQQSEFPHLCQHYATRIL